MLLALQSVTAAMAQVALSALGTPLAWQDGTLRHAGGFAAQVDLDCTAAWPATLLLLALAVFGSLQRTAPLRLAAVMLLGVAAITLVNQLRVVGVVWIGVHAPAHFAWVHEVLGPLSLVVAGAGFAGLALGRAGPVRR